MRLIGLGLSLISKLICILMKGFVISFCISLVVVDSELVEQRNSEEPLNKSIKITNKSDVSDNSNIYIPDLKENADVTANGNVNIPDYKQNYYSNSENEELDQHPVDSDDIKTESDIKNLDTRETVVDVFNKDSNNKPADTSGIQANSHNVSEKKEDLESASDEHSSEVVYNENLSLRDILRKLMPPQLSTIGESERSADKNLNSTENNSSGEEYEKDEDISQSSGSEGPCNANCGTSENETLNAQENVTNKTSSATINKKAVCVETETPEVITDVEIINSTTLQQFLQTNPNVTSRSTSAKCIAVYFFSPYCPFSTQGSAYVNALARALPNIPVYGIDSVENHSPNARYGIMGTPSLVLFHNGNVAGRFNASEFSTYHLESFIHHFTDQKVLSINVTSMDFKANLPSHTLSSTTYALYFAWAFLLTCGGYLFLNSNFYATLFEAFVNNWREAEAQHEHDD